MPEAGRTGPWGFSRTSSAWLQGTEASFSPVGEGGPLPILPQAHLCLYEAPLLEGPSTFFLSL